MATIEEIHMGNQAVTIIAHLGRDLTQIGGNALAAYDATADPQKKAAIIQNFLDGPATYQRLLDKLKNVSAARRAKIVNGLTAQGVTVQTVVDAVQNIQGVIDAIKNDAAFTKPPDQVTRTEFVAMINHLSGLQQKDSLY